MEYSAPSITKLGTLRELTLAFNKVGTTSDTFSPATGGSIVGSIVPIR
jgi:hypothetical protein